ncbi:MAG: P-loop NTPase, partial [bacterium]
VGIPMLGVVENMSYFRCPDTGKEYEIFGPSHAGEIAKAAGCEVLARLPIQPEITRLGDAGLVEEAALPEFTDLAERVERLASLLPPPREKK